MAYSNDEFAYGIFAPELSHADELKKSVLKNFLPKKMHSRLNALNWMLKSKK